MINGNDAVSTRPLPTPQPAERCGKVRVGPCEGAELAEVDLAVVVGVVSAGHAKMLNTVKDKNRGSQSDRARPSENITPRSSGPLSFRQSPAKAAKGARLKHSVLTGVRLSFDNIHLRKTWREREKERGREAHRH